VLLPGAYRFFVNVWEAVLYVRAESVQTILDFLPRGQVNPNVGEMSEFHRAILMRVSIG
jgi:hypothetical protein